MRLENKVAIITGGARGIGKAATELFVKEGCKVAIWDMLEAEGTHLVESLTAQGGEVIFLKVNVTDSQAVETAVKHVADYFGKVDILINNAGITRDKTLAKMTEAEWHQVIDVNLNGVFYCTKAVLPYLQAQSYGRIICTSSIVGITGNFGQTNYVATKSAIIGMVKTWAKELGKFNITANAVAPGFIQTEMTDLMPEEVRNKIVEGIPSRRMGQPIDIANAYLFLASDEAAYISGHCISVNGGVA